MKSKVCSSCRRRRPTECFAPILSKNRRSSWCNRCATKNAVRWSKNNPEKRRAIHKRYRDKRYAFIVQYLKSHPCVDCGNDDLRVLEFDHVRGRKTGIISRMICRASLRRIQDEIAKCEVRCANCHRIKTSKQRKWLHKSA